MTDTPLSLTLFGVAVACYVAALVGFFAYVPIRRRRIADSALGLVARQVIRAGLAATVLFGVCGLGAARLLLQSVADSEPGDLAVAIGRLAADPKLVEELGAAGLRQVARDWTWERSGDRLEAILEAALKTTTRR